MKLLKFAVSTIACNFLILPAALAQSTDIQFDLMHTKLNCRYVGYQPSFCNMDDSRTLDDRSQMVNKINAQLDRALKNPAKSQVFISYFSFSNKKVHTKLCELLKNNVNVRIVLDRGSEANIDSLKTNQACAGADLSSARSPLKVSYLGGLTSSPWRLHHNKFLYVNPGTNTGDASGDKVNINFSSGNLSAFGTSLHADHWVTAVAPKDSNLIKSYQCVMEGLEKAVGKDYNYTTQLPNTQPNTPDAVHTGENDNQVAQTYIRARENCFRRSGVSTNIEQNIARERIAPVFAPNNDNIVLNTLTSEIGRIPSNGYLYIAIQHFLNPSIGNAIVRATKKGVDVRILMDDDVVTNQGEVKGAMEFLNRLKQQAPRLKVRYLETNHLAGGNGQMMHNKFAILNGKRIFSGAGQYTTAGMKNNWENFGLTQDRNLTRKFEEYFKELWDVSVDEDYVRRQQGKGETFQELSAADLQTLNIQNIADFSLENGKILGSTQPQSPIIAPDAYHPDFLQ
ncbi:MAG: hypothetical protein K0R29_2360 [Pseudobdellovibrio sp.]|nr:hypothetical protein [Pseudobdellovibrio sp.]